MEQDIYLNNSDTDSSSSTIIDEYISKELLALPTSSSIKNNKNPELIVLSDSSNDKFDYENEILKTTESYKNRNSCEVELNKNNTVFETQDFDFVIANSNEREEDQTYFKNKIAPNIKVKNSNKKTKCQKEIGEEVLEEGSSNKKKINKKKQTETSDSKRKEKTDNKKQNIKEKKQKNSKASCNYDKYIKEIILNINESVLQNPDYGAYIKDNLESNSISYRTNTLFSGLLSWIRKIQTIENDTCESERDEKHYMLILTPDKFGSLMELLSDIKERTNFHHLFVVVYSVGKPTKAQEEEVLEVELFFQTFWQFAITKEDLFQYIFMATKCIAQMPYKLEQEIYFNESNKDSVKVDKKGNGLSRLWRQMLTMFPLARLETAEAITSVYPTLSSLFQAYEECTEPGEELIQELPIRRAQGPLASVRRLGEELSRKCHNCFTSEDNILI